MSSICSVHEDLQNSLKKDLNIFGVIIGRDLVDVVRQERVCSHSSGCNRAFGPVGQANRLFLTLCRGDVFVSVQCADDRAGNADSSARWFS